ncbi:MAG: hypothetical protein DMG61_12240 [Acidobacteria bacterium]|nr:MAG: hypothetical protein DMG61_12240 [Acidobacteriota bacterium]
MGLTLFSLLQGTEQGFYSRREKMKSRKPHEYRRIATGQGMSRELAGNLAVGSLHEVAAPFRALKPIGQLTERSIYPLLAR